MTNIATHPDNEFDIEVAAQLADAMTAWYYLRNPDKVALVYGHCVYYDPETGNKCAVGKMVPLRIAEELSTIKFSVGPEIFRELPDYLKEFGIAKLKRIQRTHDLISEKCYTPRPDFPPGVVAELNRLQGEQK